MKDGVGEGSSVAGGLLVLPGLLPADALPGAGEPAARRGPGSPGDVEVYLRVRSVMESR